MYTTILQCITMYTCVCFQDHTCFCIEDIRDLMPQTAQQCNIPCPGSDAELCGGRDGTISLYSLGGVNGYKGTYTCEMFKLKCS